MRSIVRSHARSALLIAFSVMACTAKAKTVEQMRLCGDRLVFQSPIEPPLTEGELKWVCGFPETSGTPFKAWEEMPTSQGALSLRAFLEKRGYLRAKTEIRKKNGKSVLYLEPGEPVRVTAFELIDESTPLDLKKRRKVVGALLTPDLMDEVEKWAKRELQNQGYPCPMVRAQAEAPTGRLLVRAQPGETKLFGSVRVSTQHGQTPVRSENISRSYAFSTGQLFNQQLLDISSSRILTNGILEETYFSPICREEAGGVVPISEVTVPGKPRLLMMDFGFDTETWAYGKATTRNPRIGAHDSVAEAFVLANFSTQRAEGSYQWFLSPGPSRLWLKPLAALTNSDEEFFRTVFEELRLELGTDWDASAGFNIALSGGPEFSAFQNQRGPGPGYASGGGLRARIAAQSHTKETYEPRAQSGFFAALEARAFDRSILSSFSAQRFDFDANLDWNVGDYSPAFLVLNLRTRFATTLSVDSAERSTAVPPVFLHYIGGFRTVRGFGRLELPSSGLGGLTSATLTLEARPMLLPETFEPQIYLDLGGIGDSSFALQRPLYWSPGIGLRWRSPIGPVQASLAHGYATSAEPSGMTPPFHWQFYFGWGQTL